MASTSRQNDFIMTLDSDVEDEPQAIPQTNGKASKKQKAAGDDDAQLDPDFVFDLSGDPYNDLLDSRLDVGDLVKKGSKPVRRFDFLLLLRLLELRAHISFRLQEPISVDDIIAKRRLGKVSGKRKREVEDEDEDEDDEEDEEELSAAGEDDDEDNDVGSGSEEGFVGFDAEDGDDPLATSDEDEEAGSGEDDDNDEEEDEESDEGPSSEDESEPETQAEKDRKTAFFASDAPSSDTHSSFLTMNLSRPVLKALTTLGFNTPTPIQAATIPVGLLGKDVVGNAVTGSGKTAAFIIPMIERLLYRDKGKKAAATRCLILVPTRELAVQCYEVGKKLGTHTDIQFCLIVGMLSIFYHVEVSLTQLHVSRWTVIKVSGSCSSCTTRRSYRYTWSADRPPAQLAIFYSRRPRYPCPRRSRSYAVRRFRRRTHRDHPVMSYLTPNHALLRHYD